MTITKTSCSACSIKHLNTLIYYPDKEARGGGLIVKTCCEEAKRVPTDQWSDGGVGVGGGQPGSKAGEGRSLDVD
jgi:hypothetical protein